MAVFSFLCHFPLVVIGVLLFVLCLVDPTTEVGFESHGEPWSPEQPEMHNFLQALMANYSRHIPPNRDKPTTVRLGIYVIAFSSINEQHMDYSLTFILRMSWKDSRLQFNSTEIGIEKLKLSTDMWNKIWIPDLSFRNEKRASFHHIISPNRLLALNHDGTVWLATKITSTLTCPMNLKTYPFDQQKCPIMMESFANTKRIMNYKWLGREAVEVEPDLVLPRYFLVRKETKDCSHLYPTGAYPCVEVDFVLKRDLGYFIFQIYIPSTLIVALSWVGYWIAREAVPARVSICLVTVLTVVTQTNTVNKELPQVSYVKAIDIWMAFCLFQVFASLFEYCIVNVFARRDNSRRVTRQMSLRRSKSEASDYEAQKDRNKRWAHNVDKVSRFLFPGVFLIFNIAYWTVFVTGQET